MPRNCANFCPDPIPRGRSTYLRTLPTSPSAGPTPCQCLRATCYPHTADEPTETLPSDITEALLNGPEGRRAAALR